MPKPAIENIVNLIKKFDGSRNVQRVFTDWVKLSALSISQQVVHMDSREQEYMDTARGYTKEELLRFSEMTAFLCELFEQGFDDYLGKIYMQISAGNKHTGQFFTPFNVAELTAEAALTNEVPERDITLNEPSCGGGATILAAVKALHERGICYQRRLKVTANDLDWSCVYMAYMQLALIGVDAVVYQGNSLTAEKPLPQQVFYTPMFLLNGGAR